jgi:large conductance mechanosensitive channel
MRKTLSTLWADFKAFALKGNLIDLAVAVVLGAAFAKLIDAVVKDVVMPVVSLITPGRGRGYETWVLWRFPIGHLLAELLNFLIVAAAVFVVIVKMLGSVVKKAAVPPAAAEPVTKECPFCLSIIPLKAVRCGHCTSDLIASGGGRVSATAAGTTP